MKKNVIIMSLVRFFYLQKLCKNYYQPLRKNGFIKVKLKVCLGIKKQDFGKCVLFVHIFQIHCLSDF